MKRILILLLALVMCLGCFAACTTDQGGGEETTVGGEETQAPDNTDAATLTDAVKYLRSIYKDSAKETPADYDVVGKVVIGDTEFVVTWATDNADIVVKVSEKNAAFYTIDIPVKNDTAVDYKLTATVTDANGESESVSFDRALPVYDSSAIVDKPEEQQAYKFYMIHASLGQTLFATAETQDNKYIKTTTDPKAGLDFYTEADGEGFKFYTEIDGTKMYVKASTTTSDDGKVSKYIAYSATEGTTWIYKTETNAWYTTIDNLEYVVGTYGTYNTICISDSFYMTPETTGKTQFPAGLMKKETAEAMTPSEDSTVYETPEEIVNAAYALEPGAILSAGHKYTLTGVITEIPTAWSDSYGNITVVIVVNDMTDKPIECFRLKGDGASTLAVGDTITVTGEIVNYATYNDDDSLKFTKVEFNAGCTLDSGNGSGGDGDNTDQPSDTPSTPTEGLNAQAPVVGTAYKFGFLQGNKNQIYYLTGVLSGFFMASTETYADGADFYVEETEGGYHLYCMVDGAKKYVNAKSVIGTDGKTHINGLFEDAASSVYTYDETLKTLVTAIDGTNYIFGTSNDEKYTALGPMKADSGCFHAVLVTEAGTVPTTPDEGGDETPSTPSTGEGVSEVKVDTPYYLFGTCGSGTNYFSGSVKSGRIDGTTAKASAVSVKLEAGSAAGEYYIYFMDGDTKTYIAVDGGNDSSSFALVTEKSDACLWVIDSSAKTIISKTMSGRGIATQVDSKYTNFSTYATSNFGTAEYQATWFMAA